MVSKKLVIHNKKHKEFLEGVFLSSKSGAETGAYEGLMRAKVELLEIDNFSEKKGELPMTKTEYKKDKWFDLLRKLILITVISIVFKLLGLDDSLVNLVSNFF